MNEISLSLSLPPLQLATCICMLFNSPSLQCHVVVPPTFASVFEASNHLGRHKKFSHLTKTLVSVMPTAEGFTLQNAHCKEAFHFSKRPPKPSWQRHNTLGNVPSKYTTKFSMRFSENKTHLKILEVAEMWLHEELKSPLSLPSSVQSCAIDVDFLLQQHTCSALQAANTYKNLVLEQAS